VVALTVDAEHPDRSRCGPGNCERVLEALAKAGVRATFFLQGRWVTAYPELAREVAAKGHLIGNHSHFHACMPLLSSAGQRADVIAAQEAIQSVVGVDPRPWFRPPFGAGLGDPGLTRTLGHLGYLSIPWDVDGADWEEGQTAAAVEEALVGGCLAGDGVRIVLIHSWPDQTAQALPLILDRLKQVGANFVRLDATLDRGSSLSS